MKKILSISALIGAASLIAYGAAYIPVPGGIIDGSASTQVLAGTNATVSTVLASSTNYYNIPNTAFNTNYWPVQEITPPLNVTPFRFIGIQVQTSTNLGDAVTFRYAASCDNTHWVSNAFTFTVPAQATFATVVTNLDGLGFPFWALQSIENKSASNVVGLVHVPVLKATAP